MGLARNNAQLCTHVKEEEEDSKTENCGALPRLKYVKSSLYLRIRGSGIGTEHEARERANTKEGQKSYCTTLKRHYDNPATSMSIATS